MTNRFLHAAFALALIAGATKSAAQPGFEGGGFAGLGARADGFAAVTPGRDFIWPDDHGPHAGYRIEWWYVTANLRDADGRAFGVQWTLFRQQGAPDLGGDGWSRAETWMAHAALTSADGHWSAERFARGGVGQGGVEAYPFDAWLDDWRMVALDPDAGAGVGDVALTAHGDRFSFDLRLRAEVEPILQGVDGFSVKSDRGQASYYYSQPFYEASGTVTIDGIPATVGGLAWMDREWSSQPLAPEQTGWDWFSIHLDGGEKLMLFRLREADGDAFYAGTWISEDGATENLDRTEIVMEPIETRSDGPPTRWRLQVRSHGVDIETRALFDDAWTGAAIVYWEGPITAAGTHAGVGYLEMTGVD